MKNQATLNEMVRVKRLKAQRAKDNKARKAQLYEGWANWETWNVALWINNEYELYTEARSMFGPEGSHLSQDPRTGEQLCRTDDSLILMAWARAVAFPEGKTKDGADLSKVDWSEILTDLQGA